MTRKSPIRHTVKSHKRKGKKIDTFKRGSGSRSIRVKKRVVVKEKYPRRVTEGVYIYKMLDEDQKNRFNIWLRVRTLQNRWHKTHRINWREADRVLEDANNYMTQKEMGAYGN